MDDAQLSNFEQLLLDLQEELLGVAGVQDEAGQPVELDQTRVGRLSRMDAMQMQAMALASHERREDHLNRVKEALERIEDNEYGDCLDCGQAIPIARLEIDPAIALCVHCADKH